MIVRHLKSLKANRDAEEEVMKKVPGWVTGTYYGEPVYYTTQGGWWDPHPNYEVPPIF